MFYLAYINEFKLTWISSEFFLSNYDKVPYFVNSTIWKDALVNYLLFSSSFLKYSLTDFDIYFAASFIINEMRIFQLFYSNTFFHFIGYFFMEISYLIIFIFFILLKKTVVNKNHNNLHKIDQYLNQQIDLVVILHQILIYTLAYSVCLSTYTPVVYAVYFNPILFTFMSELDMIFGIFYYNTSQIFLFFFFLFFFFIFLFYVIDYCFQLKYSVFEFLLLLFLFIFFSRLLLSCFDLFAFYLCLEGITYIIYILLLLVSRNNLEISEHSQKSIFIKYFIFNSLSSLCILFSFSLLFTYSGTLKISFLLFSLKYITSLVTNYLLGAILCIFLFGFFFKLIIFPLFFWAQDFYENMPNFLFILINIFYKFLLFTIIIKFLVQFSFFLNSIFIFKIFFIFGFFSFIFGIFGAIFTQRIRTFLFYTAINQLGFIFINLGQLTQPIEVNFLVTVYYYFYIYLITLFFFLLTLSLCQIGIFKLKPVEYFKDLQHLGRINIFIAICLMIFLLSFSGIPPFVGFFTKYQLLLTLFSVNPVIAIICIIGNVISIFYYISIVSLFFFNKYTIKNSTITSSLHISRFGFLYYCVSFVSFTFFFYGITPNVESIAKMQILLYLL